MIKKSFVVAFKLEGHDFQLAPSVCKFRKLNGCDTSYLRNNMNAVRPIRELWMDLAAAKRALQQGAAGLVMSWLL